MNFQFNYLRTIGKGNRERLILSTRRRQKLCGIPEKHPSSTLQETRQRYPVRQPIWQTYESDGFWKILQKYARIAGIVRFIPHTMRHSFATHLLENRMDLRVLGELWDMPASLPPDIYTHRSETSFDLHKQYHPATGVIRYDSQVVLTEASLIPETSPQM